MKNHHHICKNLIELVGKFPHLKENYNALIGYYWTFFDQVSSVDDYARVTPAESITRNFRKLVKLGLIELPERSKKARAQKELSFRHEFSSVR